ncbi:MAG: hypothetical protein CL928_13485 [Deltaproteobacteria bacterium]|nr:hypothetical protein [Deltaproteobacteria bacterium]
MARTRLVGFLCMFLVGCGSDTMLLGGGGGDAATDVEEETFEEFDGATLVVHEPASAAIHLVDHALPMSAEVVSVDGEVLEFEDIVWMSDQMDELLLESSEGEAELPFGIHAITATADLPNGDRLQTTLGGIRVQGEHTGIYAGNMNIALSGDFQGQAISASCVGGLDFVVDMSGELLGGDGQCTVDLLVLGSFDVAYDLSADIENHEADGDVAVDMGFFPLSLGWTGEFNEESALNGGFEGGMMLFDMEGSVEADRVSLYVDP